MELKLIQSKKLGFEINTLRFGCDWLNSSSIYKVILSGEFLGSLDLLMA